MKRVFYTMLAVLVIGFSFTSCKGEKKAEKKEEVKEVVTPVKEVKPAATVSVEETAFNAIVDRIDAANKCSVCHKADVKTIGPSYKEIAQVYKEKKGNVVKFLKEEADAIVDPAQFAVMKANLAVTKKLSGDDLAAIAAYIRSFE